MKGINPIVHAFSLDIEDWYQSSFDFNAPVNEVCVHNTRLVLDFLLQYNVKGTFFIQGLVAKAFPYLVKEVHSRGHEVQSHGYSHRPINNMTPSEFKEELEETGKRLEDITGEPVTGFRAPDFSIDKESFWAFEVMYECGIRYDSSIFPLKTSRYGIAGFTRGYSIIKTLAGEIEELPVSVLDMTWLCGFRVPVGGGGYFRLFPSWFLNYGLKKLGSQGEPFIIYCHPYDFNPREWQRILKRVPWHRRLHQGLGRRRFQEKVAELLKRGTFGSMSEVLQRIHEETLQDKTSS
jgi:polysaccharide deacetylase family protein (PEP-CTERM system associated)